MLPVSTRAPVKGRQEYFPARHGLYPVSTRAPVKGRPAEANINAKEDVFQLAPL